MTDLSSPALRPAPEAKSLAARAKAAADPATDVASAFDDFMRTFEAYKAHNDERLVEMEKRVGVDTLTTDKLDRIGAALDEHKRLFDQWSLRQARPGLGAGAMPVVNEHKAAFEAYVRGGAEQGLKRLEEKALSQGSGPDGGYLVPSETETEILRRLSKASPIRAIAGNRQVTSAVYKKPFSVTGPATGWVGETAARPQTDSPVLAELAFPAMELYAMPAATATLLDDAASISTSGSPRRSSRRSPSRKAPPSSMATASTSRRASSPTTWWRKPAGPGPRSAIWRPASPARCRPRTRPTS